MYCNWNPRVLGLLSCSYSWFLFSSYFAFSSFFNFYFISIVTDFELFLFFWGVPGFLGVFRVFLGCSWFSWECSGYFGGVPECSVMFRCSGDPRSTTCHQASNEVARGRLVSLEGFSFAFRAKNEEWRDRHLARWYLESIGSIQGPRRGRGLGGGGGGALAPTPSFLQE